MSTPEQPDTSTLCDEFANLTDAESDQGRGFSAPIVQSCAKPTEVLAGGATVAWVDGLPVFTAS